MAQLTPEQQQAYAAKRLGLQTQADTQRRRYQEDYDLQSRLANEQSSREQYDIGGQLASQGLYNSGIRINEQGQVVRRTNETLGQLNLARTRGLEDVGIDLTQRLAGVAEEERSALAEANRRETEERIQQELLQAQRDAAIRAAIPPPPPVINYPPNPWVNYAPPPPPPPAPNYAAIFPQMQQMYINPYPNIASSGSTPYKPTGWNSGVGGQPKLTPIKPGSRF